MAGEGKPQDPYLDFLPRHAAESARLDLQHQLLVENLGFLLHPIIVEQLPSSNARIADVGTGTGIWLIDLAKELPADTTFDGFDYSENQFPTERPLDRIRFAAVDAKGPLPDEYHGKFDAVHIRYLSGAMNNEEDWETVARNCLTLLKPGGWLQWHESDFLQGSRALRSDPTVRTPALADFLMRIVPRLPFLLWSAGRLEHVLEKVGFLDVLDEVTSSDRVATTRAAYSMVSMQALRPLYHKFAKADEDMSDEEIERRLVQTEHELRNGGYFRADMHVYLGRKGS